MNKFNEFSLQKIKSVSIINCNWMQNFVQIFITSSTKQKNSILVQNKNFVKMISRKKITTYQVIK